MFGHTTDYDLYALAPEIIADEQSRKYAMEHNAFLNDKPVLHVWPGVGTRHPLNMLVASIIAEKAQAVSRADVTNRYCAPKHPGFLHYARGRVREMLRRLKDALPIPVQGGLEGDEQVVTRLIGLLTKEKARKRYRSRREHVRGDLLIGLQCTDLSWQKFSHRRNVSILLARLSNARGDAPSEEFWAYVASLVETLGVEGMSDEEDITDETGDYLLVYHVPWRVPCDVAWEAIRRAKQFEALYFAQNGAKAVPRIQQPASEGSLRWPGDRYRVPGALVSRQWLDSQDGGTKMRFMAMMTSEPFELKELGGRFEGG